VSIIFLYSGSFYRIYPENILTQNYKVIISLNNTDYKKIMKKAAIIHFGDHVLREKSLPVTVFHKKLHAIIDTMKHTLIEGGDGAALAAPQIGIHKRITVINYMNEYFEMVNPEILEVSGENIDIEGCLSFPGFSGNVKRAETVKVRFQDRNGKDRTIERSGRMARCIQHEIDHLDGILFIDRMDEKFVYNDDNNSKLSVKDVLKITPPEDNIAS
jgi:peptide deformylase